MPSPLPAAPSPPFLILASGSPRRRELLTEHGYNFVVVPPAEDVECGVCSGSGPAAFVAELAYRKAYAVRQQLLTAPQPLASGARSPTCILAADTVAECDGFILGKPRDESHARAMLTQLSNREHRVLTGVCVWNLTLPLQGISGKDASTSAPSPAQSEPNVRVAVTTLRMDQLSEDQLDEYLASGQWQGKAGSFGYQDRLGWVHIVEGSASNVVGLPMELLAQMLADIHSGGTPQ